jgi:hypothetical protein
VNPGRIVARVTAVLESEGVPFALIGAAALAAHGIARSTFDIDLFTTAAATLDPHFWDRLVGVDLAVRTGDADDPLRGVVRIDSPGDRTVDIVVGRASWQTEIVARATPAVVNGVRLPVVSAPDLVLLKLFAGGAQDCWDIEQLVAGDAGRTLAPAVDALVPVLPVEGRRLWERLRPRG